VSRSTEIYCWFWDEVVRPKPGGARMKEPLREGDVRRIVTVRRRSEPPDEVEHLLEFMCGDGPSPNGRLFAPECVLDADGFLVRGSHAVGNWLVH
jgi:hypothetical protein